MKFVSLESRVTVPQAIAWTIIIVMLFNIYLDGAFQAWGIYQKSLDFTDFLIRLVKSWILRMMG